MPTVQQVAQACANAFDETRPLAIRRDAFEADQVQHVPGQPHLVPVGLSLGCFVSQAEAVDGAERQPGLPLVEDQMPGSQQEHFAPVRPAFGQFRGQIGEIVVGREAPGQEFLKGAVRKAEDAPAIGDLTAPNQQSGLLFDVIAEDGRFAQVAP